MNRSLSYQEICKIIQNDNCTYLVTAKEKSKMYFVANANKCNYINFVIHYQTNNTEKIIDGHWVSLVIDKVNKIIYFFDSYGRFPDDSLNDIKPWYRIETNQNQRDVGEFMYEMSQLGYGLKYNEHKLQKYKDGVNTCGRWVGLFCLFINNGYDEEDFFEYVDQLKYNNNFKNLDQVSIFLTEKLL